MNEAEILQGKGLTGAVAGPQLLHGLQDALVNLTGVEDRVVAVLGVVCWAGVVQVWPQAVQGEPLGPAKLLYESLSTSNSTCKDCYL